MLIISNVPLKLLFLLLEMRFLLQKVNRCVSDLFFRANECWLSAISLSNQLNLVRNEISLSKSQVIYLWFIFPCHRILINSNIPLPLILVLLRNDLFLEKSTGVSLIYFCHLSDMGLFHPKTHKYLVRTFPNMQSFCVQTTPRYLFMTRLGLVWIYKKSSLSVRIHGETLVRSQRALIERTLLVQSLSMSAHKDLPDTSQRNFSSCASTLYAHS